MSYCNSYGRVSGLGETAEQEKARIRKNVAKCNDACRRNPMAAVCAAEGRDVIAEHCDIDTGINEYGCRCGRPFITGSGVINRTSNASYGGYGNIIRSQGVSGLGETAAQERARIKKNVAKCDASCESNPIAAICRAEGRTVKAEHCDIDTGINEYGCRCGKPIVTGSGVMTTSSNRSYGGYGNIIRSQGVGGLNESFLESLGSLGNLAIIGLAIYGGFCLAKKL